MDEINFPDSQNEFNNTIKEKTVDSYKGSTDDKNETESLPEEISYKDYFRDGIPYKENHESFKEQFSYKEISQLSPPVLNPITAIDALELISMDIPPRKLMMSPWLPEKGIAMIYAPRGIGKTFFTLEIALAVATGTDFLSWETGKPKKVLYIDGEMGGFSLQPRIKKMLRGRELKEGYLQVITPDMQSGPCPDLSSPEWHQYLSSLIKDVDLIIVDNISTLCRTGNENDAESWQIVQEWAIQQKSAGKTVLFVHHAGKGGQQRGTSKREDVMDSVIALKRPDGYMAKQGARFEVHFEKSRGFAGKDAEPFVVQLEEVKGQYNWISSNLDESLFQKIVSHAKDGLSQKEIAEETRAHKSTVSKNITRAKNEGLL